jgi:hypothetical protein
MHHLLHLLGDIGVIHLALDKLSKLTKQNKNPQPISHHKKKKKRKRKKSSAHKQGASAQNLQATATRRKITDVLLPQRESPKSAPTNSSAPFAP